MTSPRCDPARLKRMAIRISLPLRHKGLGITSAALVGPLAFWSSLAACVATDTELSRHSKGLERFCGPTHAMVCERLGPPSPEINEVTQFPHNAPSALLGTFYVELYNQQPALKLQKILTRAAHATVH
jgi:hypothetical protein